MARTVRIIGCLATAALFCAALPASAKEFYVSPTGQAGAAGTREAPRDLTSVLAGKAPVQPGDTVWLMAGTYDEPNHDQPAQRAGFVCALKGTAEKPIIVRALPGQKVLLDGYLMVKGAYTWYWGFEVADSRYTEKTAAGAKAVGANTAVNVFGPGTKFINLDVHDGSMGFGFWTPAVDAEIYGCLIHDFGENASDRGHGHAIYTQNERGTKNIIDNLMWHGYGWNLHVYTQGGECKGYHVEGNIAFAAGTARAGQTTDNYLFCTYKPMDRIEFIGNVGYHAATGGRPNARLSTYKVKNIAGVCKDNYLMGEGGLSINAWEKMVVSGNTVWAAKKVASLAPGKDDQWTAGHNTYIAPAGAAAFGGKTFAEYQKATGLDADSKLIEADRPTTNFVFVRPNKYEPGRTHVAVFNWEGKAKVDVDLSSALKTGVKYQVFNVQKLQAPVAAGTFEGKPVSLPMLKSEIAPDFDAFLVLPQK